MAVDVLLGLQWGDEGKGKIVDYLANRYKVVCRFQGGPNAGHTLIIDGKKTILHTIPSGVFHDHLVNVIGNGVVIDPVTLLREITELQPAIPDVLDRLLVSKRAHLILPTHRLLDMASEAAKGVNKIGSTLRGIGPCYMDKTGRNGLRVGDVLSDGFEKKYMALKEKHLGLLRLYPETQFDLDGEEEQWMSSILRMKEMDLIDAEYFLADRLKQGQDILAEGAQGVMLDIDFGTYPYVTSSNTISSGVCSGLGIPPTRIREVIGVTKAYCTRVGSGPFPSELLNETGDQIRTAGHEFGSTTGRPRRCGWLDLPQLRYAAMITGCTQIAITKLDVLNSFETISTVTGYRSGVDVIQQVPFDPAEEITDVIQTEHAGWNQDVEAASFEELPEAVKSYLNYLESELSIPVKFVSTGPGREQLIVR